MIHDRRLRAIAGVLMAFGAGCADGEAAVDPRAGVVPGWSTAAPFPEARTEVSVATDGNRLYVAGGFGPPSGGTGGATAPRTLWSYDPSSDTWEARGEIPEGVNHAGFVHLDGRLYIVGGFRETSFTPTAAVRILNLASGQWSDGAPLPTPRGAMAVVVVDGRIHAIGGNAPSAAAVSEEERDRVTRDNSVPTHEVYDPVTDTWSRLAPMPTSRNHLGAAVVDGRIHAVGGRADGDYEFTTHEIYDPATRSWSSGPPLPTGRSGIAVVERAGRVYVFGGETPRGTFDEAERFDPAAAAWEALTPMPTGRHGLGAATIGDSIHVVSGGPSPGMAFGDAHEVLGPD